MALSDIVQVNITRETQAVTRAGFGTYGIIAEFATDKTTVTFDRYRIYGSLSEMTDDGWAVGDEVYDMAVLMFSQNPKLSQVLVGRKDAADASWLAALTAVQEESADWYCFSIIATKAATATFDTDFVTSNSIVFTINGVAVTAVPFTTDNAGTYAAIKTQIEADITDSEVTIDAMAKTVIVEIFGDQVETMSVVVTGGTTQPVGTVTYINEDDYKAAAAWAETQKKIFFYASSSAAIYNPSSETDIAYYMKNLAYARTVSIYHTSAQGDSAPSYIEAAWPGECLPYDVGEQTWAYKTLAGVATYHLTSGKRTAILAKNCNIYTTVAGVNITEQGKVAEGEYIDIIRGVDALEAALQENVYALLINNRKIPFTDEGIAVIEGTVKQTLYDFADAGFLIKESIVLTVPKYADISSADKIARTLDDIEWEANPQGAIHVVKITGRITL